MDVLSRFYSREDFHQSIEFAQVMESIGWSSIPVAGSRIAVRQLGPVSLAKMQRAQVIHCPDLFRLRSRLRIFRFIIEPGVEGVFVDAHGERHHYSFADLQSREKARKLFTDAGFSQTKEHYAHSKTALLDLTPSLEDIVKAFPSKTRYNLKISHRLVNRYSLFRFDNLTDEEKNLFFTLHTRWATDKKVFGFSNAFLNHVFKKFQTKGWMITCRTQGEFSGGMMIIVHDRVAYYFYTCTSAKGKASHVPTGLVSEALRLAKALGADIFDFCSVYDERYPHQNPRWKGFTQFKSRFHPTEVYYPPSFSR